MEERGDIYYVTWGLGSSEYVWNMTMALECVISPAHYCDEQQGSNLAILEYMLIVRNFTYALQI